MSPPLDRRSVLLGALGGLGAGAAAGLGVAHFADPRAAKATTGFVEFGESTSYAQQGEDLILANIFTWLQIPHPSYIDIGAHEPIFGNNTYLFYRRGCRGVLVEPNPALTPKLRRTRPGDQVLEIGIGAKGDDEEVDYYVIEGDGSNNTFSADVAKSLQAAKGPKAVKEVIKRKLVNINKVLTESFPKGGPDLFSTDTEGYDLTILQSLDFDRFRPAAFCVETLSGVDPEPHILALMNDKEYDVRGATFVNTIFVDRRRLRELEKAMRAADGVPGTAQ